MWGSALHTETVVVHVRSTGSPDDDGVPTGSDRRVEMHQCNVQPIGTDETRDNSRQVTTRLRVSAPGVGYDLPGAPSPGTAPGSLVECGRPGTWHIEGDVLEYTAIPHTEFTIVRVRG